MTRLIPFLLIIILAAKPFGSSAQPTIPRPPNPDEMMDEEEEDEEAEEMERPSMPNPFNQVNPNSMSGSMQRPEPSYPNSHGPAVGATMRAGPAKFKFKVVDGEFFEKGKKRGRARNGTPAYSSDSSRSGGSSFMDDEPRTPPD